MSRRPIGQAIDQLRRKLDYHKVLSRHYAGLRLITLLIAAAVACFAALREGQDRKPLIPASSEERPVEAKSTEEAPEPVHAVVQKQQPPPVPPKKTIEAKIKKGDNLFDILRKEGIPATKIHELVTAADPVHDLGRLRLGQTFTLDFDKDDGKAYRFVTDIDDGNRLIIERNGEGLEARKEALDFEIKYRTVSGSISDSLFLAADDAGLPPALTLALAEIFAWDIDFHVDMRSDDKFVVLFEEKYLDGHFAQSGRILAAGIMNKDKPFWAFYFTGSDGRTDYYDQDGRSLRKAFLKSPLRYTRISSRYSRRRYHPILKIYRPHLGVDYAAPRGTAVRTIGDGRVEFAGWKSGYGRYIRIRHNDTYTSTYGHLHRFAKGIRRGKSVAQGQLIGYVGATGLATGPHLDFRLLKNGRFINPLKVNFPDADPVRKEDLPTFYDLVGEYLAELQAEEPVLKASGPTLLRSASREDQSKS